MKVNIFPLVSSLHDQNRINENTQVLLNELMNLSDISFQISTAEDLYNCDLSLILVQSGGSEGLFLENFSKLKAPFYLLTYGHNNSLAASLEILSFLKDNNLEGEVLHGANQYIVNRIRELAQSKVEYRYGVLGKPSDWLIASQVDYDTAKRLHHIQLVDIPIEKVCEKFEESENDLDLSFDYDAKEIDKALRLHKAIDSLKEEYHLDGLTIRCFDLLGKLDTTACLSLALLNQRGVVATCEGDVPTMISMHLLKKITGQNGFQANPSRIDIQSKKMILAHCTLPLDMVEKFYLDTHFESGIGVAIKGYLKEEKITIFKLSKNLKDYYVTTGKILKNLEESNLCRTQIQLEVDDNIQYFLSRPYGNHHVVIYGDHKEEIVRFMESLK